MPFIEAPTTFYLGRRYDPQTQRLMNDVVYYDSRDLTTHAVVVGMTGSGKTGLCVSLLEEAVLDNIPAIIIDPKGDITNLLLTFPDMRPQDFQPWINVDEARRAGMEVDEYAADVAERWKEGLQAWGIVPNRVRWFRQAADFSIYTPGSDAGLPVSILDAMHAPREGWFGYEEAHNERITGIVSALLGLIGVQADTTDREHILLANIFVNAWQQGLDLTLEDVIVQVQQPPFPKLGVFDIDTYFPEKDRFKLAMALNNIIAAPSFQSWMHGEPLDVQSLLYQPDGRPRVSIFYIAHLNDAERQFMITLLLESMLAWMHTLSGTTSLRALLYIDEMFGLFPPYPKNPPTKDPLLKLLKQARAFGLGLILATQNPGDLDYKSLSNAGTWFIGKLQTENDKRRVLTGLEALADAQSGLDLKDVDSLVSQLDPRVFVMHNVHDDAGPLLLHSRWAMSYLCGPLTRQQVNALMMPKRMQMMGGYAAQPGYSQPPVSPAAFPQPAAPPASMPPGYGPAAGSGATPPPAFLPESAPPGATPLPPSLPEFRPAAAPQAVQPTQPYAPPARRLPTQPVMPPGGPSGYAAPMPPQPTAAGPLRAGPAQAPSSQVSRSAGAPQGFAYTPPAIPSDIAQYFLQESVPLRTAIAGWEQQTGFQAQNYGGATLAYKPILLAQAAVRYLDRKTEVNTVQQYAFHVPDVPKAGIIHWEEYVARPIDRRLVSQQPAAEGLYGDLSPGLNDRTRLRQLESEVVDQLYHSAFIVVPYSPVLKLYGDPGGSQRDFRTKVQALIREQRDQEVDALAEKYGKVLDRLEDKLEREYRGLEADRQELADRKREQLFTGAEAMMSLFKRRTTYTLSRYSRTQRFTRQSRADILEGKQEITDLEDEIERTQAEMERELQAVNDRWAKAAAVIEDYKVAPLKKNIQVELFGIGWLPYWHMVQNNQPVLLAAHPLAARAPSDRQPSTL